ncbi:MAG TPA: YlbF family regulator [Bacillota bacterium]|nr:hypothetical protein [Candidatus Fermentithermobacillaceae bacterium]HOB30133.1 YlbF family regulator [Bacillota bacterium]HOK64023.1 YlbF family regulator [Bacillota bacterium]HOL11378.1 YlbF family regulator [Bacillota bacterium]HOQ02507.1 YlbF family regulator [Bacillota bacterium]
MAVYDKVYELARELKDSPEYKEYQDAKQAIEQSESALQILKDYWQLQLSIQTAFLTGREPDEKTQENFQKTQEIINMHGPIQRFIHAERQILTMLTDIQRILTESLDLLDYT